MLIILLFVSGVMQFKVVEVMVLCDKVVGELDFVCCIFVIGVCQVFVVMLLVLFQVKVLVMVECLQVLLVCVNWCGYEVGIKINVDVLEVQGKFFEVCCDFFCVCYDVWVSYFKFCVLVGVFDDVDWQVLDVQFVEYWLIEIDYVRLWSGL